MKSLFALRRVVILSVLLALAGFLAGCATTPKVDWKARIGEYSYDQAAIDYGPPTKQAKQADETTIAEWITSSPRSTSMGFGVGGYGSQSGMGMGTSYSGNYLDRVMRLTFGSDGKLVNWYKNY